MKRKRVLVVVDMQPQFKTSENPKLMKNVARLMKAARNLGMAIVIVEYTSYGDTHRQLMDVVAGYDKVIKVEKNFDGGSHQVREGLYALKHQRTHVDYILCGVNADACVKSTAVGLQKAAKASARVKVRCVRLGCNGFGNKYPHPEMWYWTKQYVPNVPVKHLERANSKAA